MRRGLQVISMTLDGVSDKPVDASAFRYLSAAEVVQQAVEEYSYDSDDARERVNVVVRGTSPSGATRPPTCSCCST